MKAEIRRPRIIVSRSEGVSEIPRFHSCDESSANVNAYRETTMLSMPIVLAQHVTGLVS